MSVVLLVEDDESDILFLKRAFLKTGMPHPLHVVQDGLAAIDYLSGASPYSDRSRHPLPTQVLLDLKLPEKSGFEVLEWIRGEKALRDLPVAILTSSRESSDIRRAKELGATCYLVKPMGFTQLLEVARTIGEWIRSGKVPVAGWPRVEIARA